ncbi:MAG TPA: hypothetical protein VGV64_00310 [Thermoplasmata archaeon]|nr:hypothetical protein [Thermoplasmata archaeon]
MTRRPLGRSFDLDAATTSGALAAVVGLSAWATPFFDGLTVALAALALVTGLVRRLSGRAAVLGALRPFDRLGPLAVAVAGWAIYLSLPILALGVRDVALGAPGLLLALTAPARRLSGAVP